METAPLCTMTGMNREIHDPLRVKAQYGGFLRCPQWIPSGDNFGSFEVTEAQAHGNIIISIPQKHFKLGHLAELYFMIWLESQDRYRTLAAHLQVEREGITLGEVDYLLHDEIEDVLLHIELAFKFYLLDPSVDASYEAQWIGPNRRDSLALKLNKLRQKQFPLLYQPETRELIETLKVKSNSVDQKLCLKACFFIPEAFDVTRLEPQYRNLIAGEWIHFKAFTRDKFGDAGFCIPDKKDWLIDPSYEENAGLFEWENFHSISQKLDQIMEAKRSPLCFMKTPAGCSRIFIVWW